MHLEERVDIEAPPTTVWPIVANLEAWPSWTPTVTSVEVLDGAPLRVGLRARLTQPGYRPGLWTVTQVREGETFTWETHTMGLHVSARHDIEATSTGSRVTLSIDVTGPMAPLLGWIVMRVSRRFVPQEAAGLKAASERR